MRNAAVVVALSGVCLLSSSALAATITSLAGTPYTAAWSTLGTSGGTAAISTTLARDGNGSVKLAVSNGNKAAITFGGDRFSGPNLGTFGDLLNGGSISLDFYRAPSTVAAYFTPAIEIGFSNGSTLKWEGVYNAMTVGENTWYTLNLNATTGKFYQYKTGGVVNNSSGSQLNLTLAQWLDSTYGNDFINATTIRSFSIQAGSGWGAGNFTGFVDNAKLTFGAGTASAGGNISANFESIAVPTPTALVGGAALLMPLALRRARATGSR